MQQPILLTNFTGSTQNIFTDGDGGTFTGLTAGLSASVAPGWSVSIRSNTSNPAGVGAEVTLSYTGSTATAFTRTDWVSDDFTLVGGGSRAAITGTYGYDLPLDTYRLSNSGDYAAYYEVPTIGFKVGKNYQASYYYRELTGHTGLSIQLLGAPTSNLLPAVLPPSTLTNQPGADSFLWTQQSQYFTFTGGSVYVYVSGNGNSLYFDLLQLIEFGDTNFKNLTIINDTAFICESQKQYEVNTLLYAEDTINFDNSTLDIIPTLGSQSKSIDSFSADTTLDYNLVYTPTVTSASNLRYSINFNHLSYVQPAKFYINKIEVLEPGDAAPVLWSGYNPMLYYTSSAIIGSNSKYSATITLTASSVSDSSILTINNQSFTFKNVPSFNELIATGSRAEILISLKRAIDRNPFLNYKYSTLLSASAVTVTAIQNGSAQDATISVPSGFSLTTTGGTDAFFGQSVTGYQNFLEVWADDSTLFPEGSASGTLLGRITQDYDSQTNLVYFDVQNYLQSQLTLSLPKYATSVTSELDNSHLKCFYLIWGQEYFNDNDYLITEEQGIYINQWALFSGLDLVTNSGLTAYWSNSPFKFLTTSPNNKEVLIDSKEFLYFLWDGGINQTVQVTVNSATASTITNYPIGLKNPSNGLYYIDVSPTALNIPTSASSYSVQILKGLNPYTEVKSFKYLNDCNSNYVNLVWLNELGGFDSYTFRGVLQFTLESESETFSKPLSYTPSVSDSVLTTINTASELIYTVSTRVINKETYDWLLGLTKSNYVYINNGSELEYILVTDTASDYNSKDNQYTLKITYKRTVKSNTQNV